MASQCQASNGVKKSIMLSISSPFPNVPAPVQYGRSWRFPSCACLRAVRYRLAASMGDAALAKLAVPMVASSALRPSGP